MKRLALAVALTTSMSVAVIAPASTAGAGSEPTTPSSCVIPYEPPESVGRVEITPNGPYTFQARLATDAAQAAVDDLGKYLASSLGFGSGDSPVTYLDKGLIGVAIDHVDQQYVVVVDPTVITDTDGLQSSLNEIASDGTGDAILNVKVSSGCNSAKSLADAARVLAARDWAAGADKTAIAWYLDAHDSTFHVNLPDEKIASALEDELGSLISLEGGEPSVTSRLNDYSPHYSAAGIHPKGVQGPDNLANNDCTSLVTVDLPNGNVGSVTAAHCFALTGDGTINGRDVKSGTYHYGVTQGASGYSNGYDMVRIGPDGDTFVNKIWTDPPAADTRTTTGGGDPQVGALLCTSGMHTAAVCGAEVVDLTVTFCPAPDYICRVGIFKMHKDNDNITQGGDSGGPVYKQLTNDEAGIRGIIIGNNCGGDPCANSFDTKWSIIKDHLNVTIH